MGASERQIRPAFSFRNETLTDERGSDTAGARPGAAFAEPEVVVLGREYIDEICRLEARSYPSPWSAALIRGEFEKNVSLRLGLILSGSLLAYSFNYIVVDELHILNVAVAPEWRRRGLGRRLLDVVIRTGTEQGARFATLEVRVSNLVAQQLYESFGFRVTGRRRAYYRNNGEDALVMERTL
jgi:ribosomal-protein-alanine N-acetyltransferase